MNLKIDEHQQRKRYAGFGPDSIVDHATGILLECISPGHKTKISEHGISFGNHPQAQLTVKPQLVHRGQINLLIGWLHVLTMKISDVT